MDGGTYRVEDTVEAYDPTTDSWAQIAPMPTPRDGLGAALGPDGKIYVFGGFDGQRYLSTAVT